MNRPPRPWNVVSPVSSRNRCSLAVGSFSPVGLRPPCGEEDANGAEARRGVTCRRLHRCQIPGGLQKKSDFLPAPKGPLELTEEQLQTVRVLYLPDLSGPLELDRGGALDHQLAIVDRSLASGKEA
jgi:hypothetical protein